MLQLKRLEGLPSEHHSVINVLTGAESSKHHYYPAEFQNWVGKSLRS